MRRRRRRRRRSRQKSGINAKRRELFCVPNEPCTFLFCAAYLTSPSTLILTQTSPVSSALRNCLAVHTPCVSKTSLSGKVILEATTAKEIECRYSGRFPADFSIMSIKCGNGVGGCLEDISWQQEINMEFCFKKMWRGRNEKQKGREIERKEDERERECV